MNTYSNIGPGRATFEIDQIPESMPAARSPESPKPPNDEPGEVTVSGFDSAEDVTSFGDTPSQQDNLVDINEYKAAKEASVGVSEDDAVDPPSRVIDVRPLRENLPKPILDSPITDQRVATLQSGSATDTDKEAAFTSIYKEYYEHIKNYTTRISGSDALGQEVAQETFEKIWTKIGRFKETGEGSFKGWMFRIAHNASLNSIRNSKRYPISGGFGFYPEEILGPIKIVAGSTPIADTETTAGSRETLEEKMLILDELPPDYRAVLIMSSLDFSQVEMAQTLGKTVASIKSLLVRARASLSQRYELRQWTDMDFEEMSKKDAAEEEIPNPGQK